jgi:hypothetical protein
MRKKRIPRSGERLLEDALAALSRALSDAGAPWTIIDGIAIIARGVRRFTTDIDAAVRGDAVRPDELIETLERHDILPRIEDALLDGFDLIAKRRIPRRRPKMILPRKAPQRRDTTKGRVKKRATKRR